LLKLIQHRSEKPSVYCGFSSKQRVRSRWVEVVYLVVHRLMKMARKQGVKQDQWDPEGGKVNMREQYIGTRAWFLWICQNCPCKEWNSRIFTHWLQNAFARVTSEVITAPVLADWACVLVKKASFGFWETPRAQTQRDPYMHCPWGSDSWVYHLPCLWLKLQVGQVHVIKVFA
jgi:hypothetical protein